MPKDLFSESANNYAQYRPTYPEALFDYILSFVQDKKHAWDCATGNGQSAVPLSKHFRKVTASDISAQQLKEAPARKNIEYVKCAAENTPFAPNSFNLITVAQAYHWLNWERFYEEACRVAKNNCIVAVWMYNLLRSDDEKINSLIYYFYTKITGPYWDAERKHIDDGYAHVQFDFLPLPSKHFTTEVSYSKEDLLGYFSTWSATKNYIKLHGHSPLDRIAEDLNKIWNDERSKKFTFPIHLKIGRIEK